jgi:hypothetical protein
LILRPGEYHSAKNLTSALIVKPLPESVYRGTVTLYRQTKLVSMIHLCCLSVVFFHLTFFALAIRLNARLKAS